MVGLYHKRRALRTQSKAVSVAIHTVSVLAILGALLVLIVAIFFTGSRIKSPLASYLSAKSGLEVSINEAEFSPLYPDVIKLKDVSFGQSLISEFYLEYQLSSLWSDELKIKDIYINGLKLNPRDLEQIANSHLGYDQVVADSVRFHHTPLQTSHLQSPDATIRLNNVTYSHDHGLNFASGTVSTDKASYFDQDINGLTVDFTRTHNGLELKQFNLSVLGGMISGYGQYILPLSEQGFNYGHATASLTTNSTNSHNTIASNNSSMGISSSSGTSSGTSASASANNHGTGHSNASSNAITTIVLPELNLSKVVIQGDVDLANNLNLQAQTVNLSDVIFASNGTTTDSDSHNATGGVTANSNADPTSISGTASAAGATGATSTKTKVSNDYIVQGINGTINNMQLNAQGFSGNYQGSIDAFALHHIQTIFEHNQGKAQISPEKINFDFSGQLFTGDYSLSGSLLPKEKELTLNQVKIDKSKLAINPPRLSYLQQQLGQYNVKLENAEFSHLEFLSFLNELPLSIQEISGSLKNVHIVPELFDDSLAEAQLDGESFAQWYAFCSHLQALNPQKPSQIQWQLRNTQYSNLLMQELNGTLAITPDCWQLTLPRVFFRESSLSVDGTLARNLYRPSSLCIKAVDFESADLNSNLINHMLTGKVDFDLALSSNRINLLSEQDPTNPVLKESQQRVLNGTITLEALNLLISDLGLDLINGGKKQDFSISGTELLTAIQGSVAGISNLKWYNTIDDNILQSVGSLDLATAKMNFKGDYDFLSTELNGQADFISLAKDSRTHVTFDGTNQDLHFEIQALKRGIDRPGLYLPEYDTGTFAKEQTDAAAVLNGQIQIEPPETEDVTQIEPKTDKPANEPIDEPSLIEQNQNKEQNQTQQPDKQEPNGKESESNDTTLGSQNSGTSTAPAPEQGNTTTEPQTEPSAPAAGTKEPTKPVTGTEEPTAPDPEQGNTTAEPQPEPSTPAAGAKEPTKPVTGTEEPTAPAPEQGNTTTEPQSEPTTPAAGSEEPTKPTTGTEEPTEPKTEQGNTTTEPQPEPTAPAAGAEEPTKQATDTEEPTEPKTEQGNTTEPQPEPTTPAAGSEEPTKQATDTEEPTAPAPEQGNTTTEPQSEPTTPAAGSEEPTKPATSTEEPTAPAHEQGSTTKPQSEPTTPAAGSEEPTKPATGTEEPTEPKTEQGTTNPSEHQPSKAEKDAADLFEINLLKDAIIDSLRQKPANEVEQEPDFDFGDDDEMIF